MSFARWLFGDDGIHWYTTGAKDAPMGIVAAASMEDAREVAAQQRADEIGRRVEEDSARWIRVPVQTFRDPGEYRMEWESRYPNQSIGTMTEIRPPLAVMHHNDLWNPMVFAVDGFMHEGDLYGR